MYEYIEGQLVELTPTYAILDCNGIGYFVNISLNTYSEISLNSKIKLFLHQAIREDAHTLYGFKEKSEREVFRHLISVSGVGANTARMMLSSMNSNEIQQAILSNDVTQLKSIKGIGAKTAQRIILDLKDKISKTSANDEIFVVQNNTVKEESFSALIMLGFSKNSVEKVVNKIFLKDKNISVEDLIKKALKQL
ncbi:MAG: Holliday junction branch migration protein RuvA [Bacteroidetes bacterium]|jgi:holliday junction DNA helicase RuvA|nr:Holliday junction branch migration protein RuvA [Bacteroidota bacterium]MBT6686161.1 Holliday junction branch migration protein RuvA [Bacteroidota bacterium]MBT7143872.1 Holliday junction branch migration protein RuvA [Bacteroidota bacterium]MBT7491227.1 Holliday junction branch migration protein RuvA [Bacteroidota bacterium]